MSLLSRIPVHPLLFAAYAILFLYAANLALVLPVDASRRWPVRVAAAALVWAVLALVLRDRPTGAIVATAVVVAFFAFGHVAVAWPRRGLDDRGAARRCGASSSWSRRSSTRSGRGARCRR